MNATNDLNNRMKYRPSMTASMVEHILSFFVRRNLVMIVSRFLSALFPLKAKIDCESIAPSYVTSAKMLNNGGKQRGLSNGMDAISNAAFEEASDDSMDAPLFTKLRAGEAITDSELYLARMYGYKRNLLTDEELTEMRAEER